MEKLHEDWNRKNEIKITNFSMFTLGKHGKLTGKMGGKSRKEAILTLMSNNYYPFRLVVWVH